MIYVYGVDIYDRSPMANMLLRELSNAGIRSPKVLSRTELAFQDAGYVLSFGAPAMKELTGLEGIKDHRGEMHSCVFNEDLLVFTTYSPGFIYHNKLNLPLFREDLKLFYAAIKFDRDGVIV